MKSPLGMRRIAGSLARSIASRVPCGRPAPRPLLHSIPHRALTATKGADTASAAAATIHKLNREATSPHSDAILSASDYHFLADGALEELSLLCDGLAEVADTDDEVCDTHCEYEILITLAISLTALVCFLGATGRCESLSGRAEHKRRQQRLLGC